MLFADQGIGPLQHGQLQEEWSSLFGGFPQFQYFISSGSGIQGTLPASWGQDFPFLEVLELSNDNISALIPKGKKPVSFCLKDHSCMVSSSTGQCHLPVSSDA